MTGLILMAVILVFGSVALWYFAGMELPVAAVFLLMVLTGINIGGYYVFGWWGG